MLRTNFVAMLEVRYAGNGCCGVTAFGTGTHRHHGTGGLAGNAVILKGGKEAARSNAILVDVIREALATVPEVPVDCVQLISSREEVSSLLALGMERCGRRRLFFGLPFPLTLGPCGAAPTQTSTSTWSSRADQTRSYATFRYRKCTHTEG